MKKTLMTALVAFAANSAFAVETVDYVDLFAYQGTWYEIARLPQPFQPFCTAVTADYSINGDGTVKVVNKCKIGDPYFGFPISITGTATAQDSTNSRLDVQFFPGAQPGQYWIMELDDGYQWALVGNPSRDALYVLSRTPTLDEARLNSLLQEAVDQGYDLSNLILTRQP